MAVMTRRVAVPLLTVGLLSTAPAGLSAQEPREIYREALRAVERQDWTEAIELLRAAIKQRPEESAGTFRRYLPHYYLGLSLYELGNCKAALAVWAESAEQGVIQKTKEYPTLQRGVAECQKRVTWQAVESGVGEVTGMAAAIGALKSQPEIASRWATGDPSWAQRFDFARQRLEVAQQVLQRSDASVTLPELVQAEKLVREARQQLTVIDEEARARLNRVQAQADVRGRLVEMLVEEARETLSSIAYLEPWPPRLDELQAEVRRLIQVAADAAGAGPDRLEQIRLSLSSSLEKLRRASTPPPRDLTRAAEAFLSGEYQSVLEILSKPSFADRRATAHAHLFRAASLYGLFVAGGEQDPGLLEEASEAVRACRRQDGQLSPLVKAFSPRFVDFFYSEEHGPVPAPLPTDVQ